jgi:hypothetical protein
MLHLSHTHQITMTKESHKNIRTRATHSTTRRNSCFKIEKSVENLYRDNIHVYLRTFIECSLYRLIRRPEHLIGRHSGTSRQTEGHSFGDHLISESVSVTPPSVIEASIVLCSVSLWLVWVNVQPACALNTRYNTVGNIKYLKNLAQWSQC